MPNVNPDANEHVQSFTMQRVKLNDFPENHYLERNTRDQQQGGSLFCWSGSYAAASDQGQSLLPSNRQDQLPWAPVVPSRIDPHHSGRRGTTPMGLGSCASSAAAPCRTLRPWPFTGVPYPQAEFSAPSQTGTLRQGRQRVRLRTQAQTRPNRNKEETKVLARAHESACTGSTAHWLAGSEPSALRHWPHCALASRLGTQCALALGTVQNEAGPLRTRRQAWNSVHSGTGQWGKNEAGNPLPPGEVERRDNSSLARRP